ncbi:MULTISPECIES: hypothetical protein [Actinopolyspora]|uniref:Uncharacterized protein n=1 Tax=Actinopolyspora saharensis TaxID=995062 RepID=A0A1H0ZLD3_9ACTN|nr:MULTISPECIES: hypothetical protein [Actinopolyspora]NHD15706.1 hypothetical protein [Actinopolyspora sp. BKK2]NHE75080.1 hypothetical protein [Actinopolyspora sp. BKK1]SDQ28325.1 hypothetical protein SAMN04489718_1120 [Actinopolyspora saharensis]
MLIDVLVEVGITVFVVLTLLISCVVLAVARPPRSSCKPSAARRGGGHPLFPRGS